MAWNPIEHCPKLPGVPYLLKTAGGPAIAEWQGGYWSEWLGGGYYGTSISYEVLGYIEIPE